MPLSRAFISIFCAILLSACSATFSGGAPQPVPQSDREQIFQASLHLFSVPSMAVKLANETIKYHVVAFDGTNNDRDHVDPDEERETVVAALANQLKNAGYDVDYVPGPGVSSDLDKMICYSCLPKAKAALERLRVKIERESMQAPDVEVRILVIGFSRGAAIGRHFMNLVSDTWPANSHYADGERATAVVRTVGLLFDTVATGKEDVLRLGISPTTDHLIHLVARDERRSLFKVVLDQDEDFFAFPSGATRSSERMTEITLPGVHSDVGGSYLDGVGTAYRILAEQILVELHLLSKNEWTLGSDIFRQGAHDSRGYFDKITGTKRSLDDPWQRRDELDAKSSPLTEEQKQALNIRLKALKMAKWQNFQSRVTVLHWDDVLETAKFSIVKQHNELNVQPISNWIHPRTLSLVTSGGERRLRYGAPDRNGTMAMSEIKLSEKLLNAIPDGKISTLEIVVLKLNNGSAISLLVNGQEIETFHSSAG